MAKRPAEPEEHNKRPADEGPAVAPELMQVYYERVFPTSTMFRWLSYKDSPVDGKEYFSRREFSMTLPGDIYVRYKSFADLESFRRAINDMQPEKIDIGAVFSFPPKDHKMNLGREFVPTDRELVFDIDMDDYDDIRTSGTGKMMTKDCWTFMASAVTCLNTVLRQDFGFEHVLIAKLWPVSELTLSYLNLRSLAFLTVLVQFRRTPAQSLPDLVLIGLNRTSRVVSW
jgi:DNA primase small subunit